jgi:hypothetical protein
MPRIARFGAFFWVLQTAFVGAGEACDLLILKDRSLRQLLQGDWGPAIKNAPDREIGGVFI